jgi:hypothetical protein
MSHEIAQRVRFRIVLMLNFDTPATVDLMKLLHPCFVDFD